MLHIRNCCAGSVCDAIPRHLSTDAEDSTGEGIIVRPQFRCVLPQVEADQGLAGIDMRKHNELRSLISWTGAWLKWGIALPGMRAIHLHVRDVLVSLAAGKTSP